MIIVILCIYKKTLYSFPKKKRCIYLVIKYFKLPYWMKMVEEW